MTPAVPRLEPRQWRQVAGITAAAVAVFVAVRALPTGTNLSHMDFRVDARNSIEFCDPANPQFIPVVAVASPVTLRLQSRRPAAAEAPADFTLTLRTAQGKPIDPADLLVAHTRLLHLLIVDPTLQDYQHVHPEPTGRPGQWTFSFSPRFAGRYRVFADFTPVATARSLYASADVEVAPPAGHAPAVPVAESALGPGTWDFRDAEYRYTLRPGATPVRRGQPLDLGFRIVRLDGGPVGMEPVMGAFAHLVAFDQGRSGFAHLHPLEVDLLKAPDARQPRLDFKIKFPRAGRYVIWGQVRIGGRERFAPFWFDVRD